MWDCRMASLTRGPKSLLRSVPAPEYLKPADRVAHPLGLKPAVARRDFIFDSLTIRSQKKREKRRSQMRNMGPPLLVACALVVGTLFVAASSSWAQDQSKAVGGKAVKHAVAPPLS